MSTNLEYGATERQIQTESRRQAGEAQREKKNKGDIILVGIVAAETKWEMLAATKARRTRTTFPPENV